MLRRDRLVLVLVLALICTTLGIGAWLVTKEPSSTGPSAGPSAPRPSSIEGPAQGASGPSGEPIRAAFYYPWFPETWHDDDHYTPSLGKYSSDDPAVLDAHFASMKYARLDAAISSWWGQGKPTDRRLPAVLDAAAANDMKVAPYYEPEYGAADPTTAQVRADLDHLARLTSKPGWLHVDGKPVIFVYNAGATGCGDVTRWKDATNGWTDFYVQMKVFSGFADCADQPDSWHQYGPAVSRSVHLPYSFNVSPGFWHHRESTPRLVRSLDRFTSDLRAQVASGAHWQLVTSFSEWGEGTSVESATQWASASGHGDYLDAMRKAYRPVTEPPVPPTTPPLRKVVLPRADAHVTSARPRTNLGTLTSLAVERRPVQRAYLKFDVPRKPARATLRVWSRTGTTAGFSVSSTTNRWSERRITYRNAPAPGTRRDRSGRVTAGSWVSLDVTAAVRRAGAVSLVLRSSSDRQLTFNARERARRQPRLVLEQRPSDPMVVWAAGDLCDDSDRSPGCADVGRLIAGDPQTDHFLALGDLQYEQGELPNFEKYYDPAVGAGVGLKTKTWPAVGNHEYLIADAAGYFDYWGTRAGERHKGYYATMLGSWRLIVANTNCSEVDGCDSDSPQGRWLAQQLAESPRCTVVVAHDPAISDGVHGSGEEGKMIFDAAYDGGAELLLSGHDHVYQRFAPMNKSFDVDHRRGVRQFVSGAGGKNLTEFEGGNRSEYRQNTHAGALRLVLDDGSYSWQFRTTDGTVMDSGSNTCH